MSTKNAILTTSAFPIEDDDAMGIKMLGPNQWEIDVPYRKADGSKYGTPTHLPRVRFEGTAEQAFEFAASIKVGLKSSLKSITTSEHVIARYRKIKGDGGNESHWNIIEKRFAGVPIDSNLLDEILEYRDECPSIATFNRRMACFRAAIRYAAKKQVISADPIADEWPIDTSEETERSRILSIDENTRLFTTLTNEKSYLLPAIHFARYNPIRAEDLRELKVSNLLLDKGEVQFTASKTNLFTRLVVWDSFTIEYFRNRKATAKDSDFLFCHTNGSPIGRYHKHWCTIKKAAKIEDFRFHDLRHCAATDMVYGNPPNLKRWTVKDFQDAGLWASLAMLLRYTKADLETLKTHATNSMAVVNA